MGCGQSGLNDDFIQPGYNPNYHSQPLPPVKQQNNYQYGNYSDSFAARPQVPMYGDRTQPHYAPAEGFNNIAATSVASSASSRGEACQHLESALQLLGGAQQANRQAKNANTAQVGMGLMRGRGGGLGRRGGRGGRDHGLIHRNEGLLGDVATMKEHASMRKAQEFAQMAQREIDIAESICPDLPIMVDGVRVKKGGIIGMFMFNGFLGEMHYRQMISKNEVNIEKMMVAVQAGIRWCRTAPVVIAQSTPIVQVAPLQVAAAIPVATIYVPEAVTPAPVAVEMASITEDGLMLKGETMAMVNPNKISAITHLQQAQMALQGALKANHKAKTANSADMAMGFMGHEDGHDRRHNERRMEHGRRPEREHGLIHHHEGLGQQIATVSEHSDMRKAQEYARLAQVEIDTAQELVPEMPMVVDGVRVKKGSMLGMFMFNGFLGDVHYRQMISKNEVNLEKMIVAVNASLLYCESL